MNDPARILVVEDEPQLRALLRLYLERAGYDVTDVGDGASALSAYDAQTPDLVILDLMLPTMQGETVLEELRDRGSAPVLRPGIGLVEDQQGGRVAPDHLFRAWQRDDPAAVLAAIDIWLSAVVAHRLRMAERLLPMRARAEGDALVFVDPKGDPFNGAHITERALKPLLRREGLREIRFHDLRHAFASLMVSQGAWVDLP